MKVLIRAKCYKYYVKAWMLCKLSELAIWEIDQYTAMSKRYVERAETCSDIHKRIELLGVACKIQFVTVPKLMQAYKALSRKTKLDVALGEKLIEQLRTMA